MKPYCTTFADINIKWRSSENAHNQTGELSVVEADGKNVIIGDSPWARGHELASFPKETIMVWQERELPRKTCSFSGITRMGRLRAWLKGWLDGEDPRTPRKMSH